MFDNGSDGKTRYSNRRTFLKGLATSASTLAIGTGAAAAQPTVPEPKEQQLVGAMTEETGFSQYVSAIGYRGLPEQSEVITQSLQNFPVEGSEFTLLSTGRAADAPGSAETFGDTQLGGISEPTFGEFGDEYTAYDMVWLCLNLSIPEDARRLSFDYKFGTEENPQYLGQEFQDNFRAVLTGPDDFRENFALLPNGNIVDVDNAAEYSNAPGGTDSANPEPPFPDPNDVIYNAMTQQLTASIDFEGTGLSGGSAELAFRLVDASDERLDSAIFLDNLRMQTS